MDAGLCITEIINGLTFVKDFIRENGYAKLVDVVQQSQHVFCYSLERADFSMKAFAMRLMHMDEEVYLLTETITPSFGPGDLLIVSSTSGETAQLVALTKKACQFDGAVVTLTINQHTAVTKFVDVIVQINTPSRNRKDSVLRSAQPMTLLYEQTLLVTADALMMRMAAESDAPESKLFKRRANPEQLSSLFARYPTGE